MSFVKAAKTPQEIEPIAAVIALQRGRKPSCQLDRRGHRRFSTPWGEVSRDGLGLTDRGWREERWR